MSEALRHVLKAAGLAVVYAVLILLGLGIEHLEGLMAEGPA